MSARFWEALQAAGELLWSPTGNTLVELAIVTFTLLLLLLASLAVRQRRATAARARIPLVVGGWGTRGKSGTERKKAALLEAIGARVVCKTTGCEAMLVIGDEMDRAREFHLYRPHGKASIWEQVDVLHSAAELGADVLLWECMALREDYAQILQDSWSRDDLTTIVNAHPDHLDLQGPSGRDVALTIAGVIPREGRVLTTETQMLPILRGAARRQGATLEAVDPRRGERICPDVLARFPYTVHPSNLELEVRFGELLGLSRDFVLKETADFIIPDLGVLKTYPSEESEIHVRGRRLRFSNSMSANERTGTLSNWRRLGLDRPELDRREWIVVVVNNREDRTPRSEEFASAVVNDLSAHLFILIGTNLRGLRGFIETALEARLARLIPPSDLAGLADWARWALERDAAYLRALPRTEQELSDRIADYLGSSEVELSSALLEAESDEFFRGLEELIGRGLDPARREPLGEALEAYQRYLAHTRDLERVLEDSSQVAIAAWVERHRAWFRESFLGSLISVGDPYIPGDALVRKIALTLPPRARGHLVGVQNIKGTGLNFAQRWFRLGQIQRALDRLDQPGVTASRALETLEALENLVPFEVDLIRRAVGETLAREIPPRLQRGLRGLLEGLPVGEVLDTEAGREGLLIKLLSLIEPAVDMFLSVGRTRRARQALADLESEQISVANAKAVLGETSDDQGGAFSRLLRRRG
ncbi:MAG: hypothetical protein JKY65_02180 [Planctomycetes bacterium]|nr:hypothetical protein [Planctomycetota bacterium]